MTESDSGSASVPWPLPTARAAPVVATMALSGLLLVAPTIGGPEASGTVGLVLLEAIALYVGYGVVTRAAGPTVRGVLASR